ncbi:hypothetical protein [Streptomyces sp. NPDC001165]|uniref:hypothetical protein n=1 Tax=Streptomyces sp. NPDC001165 TaxID=3364546 RepID=UPI0036C71CB6
MSVPQCVHAPYDGSEHGTKEWHVIVITVTITVIASACAGMNPNWIAATAALLAAMTRK